MSSAIFAGAVVGTNANAGNFSNALKDYLNAYITTGNRPSGLPEDALDTNSIFC
jgi:hypothetical protein